MVTVHWKGLEVFGRWDVESGLRRPLLVKCGIIEKFVFFFELNFGRTVGHSTNIDDWR